MSNTSGSGGPGQPPGGGYPPQPPYGSPPPWGSHPAGQAHPGAASSPAQPTSPHPGYGYPAQPAQGQPYQGQMPHPQGQPQPAPGYAHQGYPPPGYGQPPQAPPMPGHGQAPPPGYGYGQPGGYPQQPGYPPPPQATSQNPFDSIGAPTNAWVPGALVSFFFPGIGLLLIGRPEYKSLAIKIFVGYIAVAFGSVIFGIVLSIVGLGFIWSVISLALMAAPIASLIHTHDLTVKAYPHLGTPIFFKS